MQLIQDYIEESTEDNVEPILMQGVEGEGDEDTLSLCDLPIYSSFDSAEVEEELNSESQSSNTVSSDYFEFFSEELMTKNNQLPENIIFCGKLIPSRKPNISEKPLQNLANSRPRKQKKWYHFQCIIALPFYKRKNSSRKRDNDGSYNSGSLSIKDEEEMTTDEISSDKISIIPSPLPSSLLSSSSGRKSRWYLLLFGITKLPTHNMDLSDLRNRTSRRQIQSSISSSSSSSSSSSVSLTTSSLQLTNNCDGSDGGRDFWWVVRALSCGGSHHAQAMVNASIGCFNMTKM